VASGLEEERLRLPVRGSGVRAVGCAISGLGFGLEEAGGASDAARQAGSSRSLDLDGRQAVCALALEGRGLAFGSEGRRRRGSSGKGG